MFFSFLNNKTFYIWLSLMAGALCTDAHAGLLEMPEIKDSTPLRGKSVYENMDVPPVRERDPNPEAGARIWVKQIKLQGVVDRSEYGIYKKDLDAYVEQLRYIAMHEEELLKYGYSLEDLAEVAELMLEIDAANNMEQVTEPDVQRLIWLVRELKERRGLTLGNIDTIAEKVTDYYRKRGFFLTKVYIPQQEVRDGVVGLTVLEGKLGEVKVSGNKRYSSEFLASAFDKLMYQPVNEQDIEQKLYLLNDYPGLNVYGYFKAGEQVGDTSLNVEVRRENPWTGTLRFDNYGSELTGKNRFYAQFQWHNPTGHADNLGLAIMQTASPDNSTYGTFQYKIPVISEAFYTGLYYSQNQFVIGNKRDTEGLGPLGISGDTRIGEIKFEYLFIRSRKKNLTGAFSWADKDSDLVSDEFPNLDLSDRIQAYSLQAKYDSLSERTRLLHQLNMRLAYGEVLDGAAEGQEEAFTKVNAGYSMLTFFNLPWTNSQTRLIFKSAGQFSNAALRPVEQFPLTGPNYVRAYPVNILSADSGVYTGIDWVFIIPRVMDFPFTKSLYFSQVFQPFLFLDYGYGQLNQINNEGNQTGQIAGYGLGVQVNYKGQLMSNIQFAKPLSSSFSDESTPDPGREWRFIFDIQYIF